MTNQKMYESGFEVGLVGATGLVGKEILKILEERSFPISRLCLWASERSAGEKISFGGREIEVQALDQHSFQGQELDFVWFASGGKVAEEFAPKAASSGAVVIDNSSHFRLNSETPLVVPEVNPDAVELAKKSRLIANPNCSTIQLVVALKPLAELAPLKRVVVSTYQSVSGAGADAMEELREQIQALFGGEEVASKVFPRQIAFNCLPHIDVFFENGMTKEEMKMIRESRKILNHEELAITATAVRVPTFVSHGESVNIEFSEPFDLEDVKEVFSQAPGIRVIDEPSQNLYPTPFELSGHDEVFVGRIRKDESVPSGLQFWLVADNLRKGAATNAIQIAEICIQNGIHRRAL